METLCPVVLITEVTRGVGYEISKLFARAKYRMIIVGHECATLHNVSEILKTLGAPTVQTICMDLSEEDSAEAIMKQLGSQAGIISVLINCIGGHEGKVFAEDHIRRQSMIIHRDVVSVVKLTSLMLDQMRWEGRGTIVQVLADSNHQTPEPAEHGSYAFLKAYMQSVCDQPRNAGIKLSSYHLPVQKDSEEGDHLVAAKEFFQQHFEQEAKTLKPRKNKKIAAKAIYSSSSSSA